MTERAFEIGNIFSGIDNDDQIERKIEITFEIFEEERFIHN